MLRWLLRRLLVAGIVLVAALQLIPYGRAHTNPPVRQEPAWDSARTRELVVRACYDCHSNETDWPWYSHLAPVSWLVQRDVDKGRAELNFSEWNRPQREAREAAETVQKGTMPPALYVWLRPQARLLDAERQELIRGLQATFGAGERAREGRRRD